MIRIFLRLLLIRVVVGQGLPMVASPSAGMSLRSRKLSTLFHITNHAHAIEHSPSCVWYLIYRD